MDQLREAIERDFNDDDVTQMHSFGLNPDIDADREEWVQTTPTEDTTAVDYSQDPYEFGSAGQL